MALDVRHQSIARGMVFVVAFTLVGKLAGAAKEVAVAYRYGVSADMDAYIFVTNLVSWPVGVWFSVVVAILLPLAARVRHEATGSLPQFRSELFGLSLMVGFVMAGIAWLGMQSLLRANWTGLTPSTAALAANMAPTLVLLIPSGMVISVFSAWMLAGERHANTLLEGVPAVVIGISVLAFPGATIEPLVWGTLAGFLLHAISLAIPLSWQQEMEAPRLTRKSAYWTPFWSGFWVMLAGQVLMSFVGVVDPFFAAQLGPGAISTLGYANRVLGLVLALGATAVGRATLPVFSKQEALGVEDGHRLANQWAGLLFVLGAVGMVVGWIVAPLVIQVLFERGAFNARDTVAVTGVFRAGLVQLPFYFAALVLVSYLASQRRYKVLFWTGAIGIGSKLIANMVLIPVFGINGIALAWGVVYALNALFLWFVTRRWL